MLAPRMATTDVMKKVNRSYPAFLGQRYERMGGREKTEYNNRLYIFHVSLNIFVVMHRLKTQLRLFVNVIN